jgi:hypothetical protein
MDKLFESINEEDDYEKIAEKILYQENREKLKELYTEEEFVELDNSVKKKIWNELSLNFGFVFTFGTSITAFFPMIESFIKNSGIDQIEITKETVVYLSICTMAIVLGNPKQTYRKLFSELRLRNVYGFLKDLTSFVDKLKDIFNFITGKIGKVAYDIVGMFSYTALFVPFALTMADILSENTIDLTSILNAIQTDGLMKLTSIGIGVSGLTIRELIADLVEKIKRFNFSKVKKYLSKSFQSIKSKVNYLIKKIKSKLDTKEIDKELKEREVEVSGVTSKEHGDILKWDQWKKQHDMEDGVERIDETGD